MGKHKSVPKLSETWVVLLWFACLFSVANANFNYALAPSNEISDGKEGVILKGQVLDRNCNGISGATVEVWYAGGPNAAYTFRPRELLYRGKRNTNKDGYYTFLGTFPGTYSSRPIPHIHYKVTSPGRNGRSLTTQMYFRDRIPRRYETYAATRGTQFATVTNASPGNGLQNGGRIITFNLKMNVN